MTNADQNEQPDSTEARRYQKAVDIFLHSCSLDSGGRADYVKEACGEDSQLLNEVNAMLEQDSGSAALSKTGQMPESSEDVDPHESTHVGRYKLLQRIGKGGMGAVYMAQQDEPVRRKVALKIIKAGLDTEEVVARFEAERQALAMMDHPNIARVLDAGTTDEGRPFFVMELIHGISITEFCDRNHLTVAQRLALFVTVCRAVQSAHQKGIIHRDIKPSNVLVTLRHGEPTPKVIDFGVAKATNQKLTEKTYFTRYGSMIGTPAYMSPEQAELSGMDVDTRADVYSLGVLLYELLTGSTPFPAERLRSVGYGEMQRIIAEEEPERPSVRRSTSLHTKDKTPPPTTTTTTGVTLGSGTESSHAGKLSGELDWITLKCLEKDRRRRYETPSELAADVRRYLDEEPVLAVAPTLGVPTQETVPTQPDCCSIWRATCNSHDSRSRCIHVAVV